VEDKNTIHIKTKFYGKQTSDYSLSSLINRVAVEIRRDILCSGVVFPRTSSLREDKPLITIGYKSILDIEKILDQVRNEPEFIAVSAKNDLVLILEVLKEVKEELLLEKMDSIQIYRGGVDLLLIKNEMSDGLGRSAFIEINDYRRRLQSVIVGKENSYLTLFLTVVSFLVLIAAIKYIFNIQMTILK